MKRLMLFFVMAMAATCFADTYVWTGAGGDGMWMNAANWSLNGVAAPRAPGVPWTEVETVKKYDTISADGLLMLNDCVEFGTIANASTEIDLDGLYAVSNITIKAGAPKYKFGTSSDQVLPLCDLATLTLESGLGNMPEITAKFSLGAAVARANKSTVTIDNKSGMELSIGDIAGTRRLSGTGTWGNAYFYLMGTGTFRFTGAYVVGDSPSSPDGINFYLYAPKMTVESESLQVSKLLLQNANVVCEIVKDAKLFLNGLNGLTVSAENDASIIGEGQLEMRYNPPASFGNNGYFNVNTDKTLTIEPTVSVVRADATKDHPRMLLYGSARSGVLYIKGGNETVGRLTFVNGNRTFKTNHPGGFCLDDTIEFWANGNVSPAYTNGEDFVKTLAISNGFMATIVNERETAMTARPTVVAMGENAAVTLCSKPVTAPIVLDPTFTEGQSVTLGVDGVKETRPTAATLAAIAGVRLMGGILDVSSVTNNWSPTVPVTYDTGAAEFVVPDGETYVFSSLGRTSGKTTGTLNIVCGTGRAKIAGASAGTAPAGLTVNGFAAEIRDGGVIAPVSPTTDVQIAARGDEVPNAPSSVVGITADGTDGNDTIAEAATAVKELVHVAAVDATVEIGEGRSLTAEKLTLIDFAGSLNVGADGDLGTVGSSSGSLVLKNDNSLRDLTVKAKLADGLRVVGDGGVAAPTIAGGSAATNSVVVRSGTLKVSGERTFDFDFVVAGSNETISSSNPVDWPTIRFDGAKDVILGERGMQAAYTFLTSGYNYASVRGRIIVTNSLIRSCDMDRSTYPSGGINNEKYAIVVGNRCSGLMEIQEGAVITNRIAVGPIPNGHRGFGAVYQTGGEVAALGEYGSDSSSLGSGVCCGSYGEGYYNLSSGKLTSFGPFVVGSSGRGYFRQTGGVFAITNHPSDTSASPRRTFGIGNANSANGSFWVSGGRCDLPVPIRLCGAFAGNSARTVLAVDGTAYFDAHESSIRVISAGVTPHDLPHHSYISINGDAVVRASGFCDSTKTTADASDQNRFAVVGFNGGTFRTGASSKAIFHDYSNKMGNTAYSVEHVYVYAGGIKVDTDGKEGNFIDVPLVGATGGGVSKVNFTPTEKQASYHMPPLVEISGDGIGATAFVDWDVATKKFKGITITSPGVGYTYATANVYLGGSLPEYSVENIPCDISVNANTGSFTKMGEGDLTLAAVNTYGGDTVLAGGTLRVTVSDALPDGSALVPQGGILEVAEGVELPSSITVKLQNPDPSANFDLMRFPNGFPETLPAFTVTGGGDNEEWVVKRRGDKLVVGAKRGLSFIIR